MKKKYAVKDLVTGYYYYGKYGCGKEVAFGDVKDSPCFLFASKQEAKDLITTLRFGHYTIETIYIP